VRGVAHELKAAGCPKAKSARLNSPFQNDFRIDESKSIDRTVFGSGPIRGDPLLVKYSIFFVIQFA
jgi:hypothetical protein